MDSKCKKARLKVCSMREIKFRGKVVNHDPMTNPENGWVEGYYLQDLDNGVVKHYIFNCPMKWEVIPETIGQFTGLRAKNGKEIYEGDIVKWILTMSGMGVNGGYEEYKFEEIGEIKWDAGALQLGEYCAAGFAYESEDYAEIIGNIHDNPELLESL